MPSNCESSNRSTPRLILVDDNIRDVGGHYFELATLLLRGAESLGFESVLATHSSFDQRDAVPSTWKLQPTFHTRRLVRWSLGVDGNSDYQRDMSGKSIGGSGGQNLITGIKNRCGPPAKRPQVMLRQWSDDLCTLLNQLRIQPSDNLLVSTGDDFAMLALAAAVQRAEIPPIRIDVIFHFALYDAGQSDRQPKLRQLGRQIRSAIDSLRPHAVHLHATTDSLAAQLRETECGTRVTSIPYPTRPRVIGEEPKELPIKAVLAGLPRAEKGRGVIAELLSGVENALLKTGRFQISMQMPEDRWQGMVPKTLHRSYEKALLGDTSGSLEIMTSNLSTKAYHDWIDTADLGLFLYEPSRYVARCSGVLLEMLARGVPVIVPDGCWLADQVRLAGGHRSIGFIYQDRAEIPDLMRQFAKRRDEIQPRSTKYAPTIARRHDGENTLVQMGLQSVDQSQRAA